MRRRYLILKDGVQYAQYGDRFRFRPEGLVGGEAGAAARCILERDGKITLLSSKTMMELRAGDILTVETGGGGGCGNPAERASADLDADVANGFVTPQAADRDFRNVGYLGKPS